MFVMLAISSWSRGAVVIKVAGTVKGSCECCIFFILIVI